MPRGRRSSPSPVRARSPTSHVPARAPAAAPAHVAPASAAAAPRQPGLMAQMASTAAGVAIGSAVGHTIGHAMMGSGSREEYPAEQQQLVAAAGAPMDQQSQQLDQGGPCQMHMRQFLECAQTQPDITLCQGFNEALRECKMSHGMSN